MRIAITGASGSLGGHLLNRLAKSGADRIVGITRTEDNKERLESAYGWHAGIKIYAGDITAGTRDLEHHFAGCDVVVHAAARKRVKGDYDEIQQHKRTNVDGTQNVLDAARDAGVPKVLFISSDKAVHPCNTYGKSKAEAEDLVIAENVISYPRGMRRSVLRYGNVLASNGSVIRKWRAALAAREPLEMSDERMTRFWLTLDAAVDCVLRALSDMRGGEIFVPMLKTAALMRLKEAVGPNAPVVVTGIRAGGEKLHEILVSEDEVRRAVRRNQWIVIPPTDSPQLWDRSPWLGTQVAPEFTYRSDTWPEQWSVADLRALLAPASVEAPA